MRKVNYFCFRRTEAAIQQYVTKVKDCRTFHGLDERPLLLAGALHLRGEVGFVEGRAELDGVV